MLHGIFPFTLALIVTVAHAGPTEDLFDAIESRDVTKIETAIADGADVNAENRPGETPLIRTLSSTDDADWTRRTVKLLLEAGAKPNKQVSGGHTAMHALFMSSVSEPMPLDAELVLILGSAGGRVGIADHAGFTPFHLACQYETAEIVLLAGAISGFDVDTLRQTTKSGWTPGMLAATSNDPYWQTYFMLERSGQLDGLDEAQAEAAKKRALFSGGMTSTFNDGKQPSAKLWFLIRVDICDVDAETTDGHTIASLIKERSDPEALLMKSMLELHENNSEAVRIQPADGRVTQSMPVPDSLRDYFNVPVEKD